MENGYKPYFDPEFESLIERIHPPRVCIDNDTCKDCTLVKVDSANKHGILLEMVQVLTDLDLLISKSYISSDGGWLMDVFHVTDQLGNKLTDDSLIHHIQQSLSEGRRRDKVKVENKQETVKQQMGSVVGSIHFSTDYTAFEMTAMDRPGLLSEVSAVLAELGCNVSAAVAWTHNTRAACILYVEDHSKGGGPITDKDRLVLVEEQLENVVAAHHNGSDGEKRMVRLVVGPVSARIHTERRLHQLMSADRDYEIICDGGNVGDEVIDGDRRRSGSGRKTEVTIEYCKEKWYWVVYVRCRDRPKLLFDTVCTLTDMNYVVFHAAISSRSSVATQEYYVRHVNGCTSDTEAQRRRVKQSLIAAAERRVSHGLRFDVSTRNRVGLLSDITRVFRENGLSVSRAEISTRGEKAVGSFYVTDASSRNDVNPETIKLVRNEIGPDVLVVNRSTGWPNHLSSHGTSSSRATYSSHGGLEETPSRSISWGSLLWSQFERLSGNFGSIKS